MLWEIRKSGMLWEVRKRHFYMSKKMQLVLLVPKYPKQISRRCRHFSFFYVNFGLRPQFCLERAHMMHSCLVYPESTQL